MWKPWALNICGTKRWNLPRPPDRLGTRLHLLCMLYQIREKRPPVVLLNFYRYVWSHSFLCDCVVWFSRLYEMMYTAMLIKPYTLTHTFTSNKDVPAAPSLFEVSDGRARAQCTSPLPWLMNPSLGWWPSDCKQEVDHGSGPPYF